MWCRQVQIQLKSIGMLIMNKFLTLKNLFYGFLQTSTKTLDGLVRFYFNISNVHVLIVSLAAQFIRTDKKLTGKKIGENVRKSMFECLNDCFFVYPECVAVETSLSLNSELPINCLLRDDNKVNENEIDFKKQNFILKGESFHFAV